MKDLSENLKNIVFVQAKCASFFEAVPEAAKTFVKVISETCAKNDSRKDSFSKVEITLAHGEESEWRRCVKIRATFTRTDASSYSYGATYWTHFTHIPQ